MEEQVFWKYRYRVYQDRSRDSDVFSYISKLPTVLKFYSLQLFFTLDNSGCGENIYKASYAASWSKVIGFWNSEYENFVYGTGPKTNKSMTEDYVQVKKIKL